MDSPLNTALPSEPIMKIPSSTMQTGQNELLVGLKHSEEALKSLRGTNSVKPWTSLKSNAKPHCISQKLLEPRVLKVTEYDMEVFSTVLQQHIEFMKGTIQ